MATVVLTTDYFVKILCQFAKMNLKKEYLSQIP